MIPDATRLETEGSLWWFDDTAHKYLRMPKQEGPRKSPPGEDWGGVGAGSLQDLVWHDMVRWEVRVVGSAESFRYRQLIIWIDDPDIHGGNARVVTAPVGPA